jgi:hypothetical protein
MNNLQELCFINISNSIQNSPPLIQEMILDKTKKQIEDKVKNDIYKSHNDIYKTHNNIISDLTPEILENIIYCMRNNTIRKNYREIYSYLPEQAVECAILTAENCATNLEQTYISNLMEIYVNDED